jgi:hypothetical protein
MSPQVSAADVALLQRMFNVAPSTVYSGAPAPKATSRAAAPKKGTGHGTAEAVGTGHGTAEADAPVPMPMVQPAPVAVPPTLGQGVPTGPMAPQGMAPRTVCSQGVCQQEWAFINGAPQDAGYINQVASGGPIDPITAGFMADYMNKSQQSRSASIQSGDALYQQQLTQTPQFQAAFRAAVASGAATPAEAAAIAFGQTGMVDVVARNPNNLTNANESRYKRTAPQFVASGQPAPYTTPGYMDYKGASPQADGSVMQSFGMGDTSFNVPTTGELAPGTALQFMQLPQMGAPTDPKLQRNLFELRARLAQVAASRANSQETNATRRAISAQRTASSEKRTAETNQTRKELSKGKDKASAPKFDPKKVAY